MGFPTKYARSKLGNTLIGRHSATFTYWLRTAVGMTRSVGQYRIGACCVDRIHNVDENLNLDQVDLNILSFDSQNGVRPAFYLKNVEMVVGTGGI